jgi:hypothetical protein
MTATGQSPTVEPPPRKSPVGMLRMIAVTAAVGAAVAVAIAIFLPSDDVSDPNAVPGTDGSATVCDLIPAELIKEAAPGAIGFSVPANGGSACRWSVLLEDTPGRRIHREVALTVTSGSDPAANLAKARETLEALDPVPEVTEVTDPGDGGLRAVLDPSVHRFLEHSLVGLSFTTGKVTVDIELSGWMKEGESPARYGVSISDLQPVVDQIGAAVAERLSEADEASTEHADPETDHPVEDLPADGCDLLTDEIVSEYVSKSAETAAHEEIDYPNCNAGGDLDPTARADGATYRSIGLFVRTADGVDQAATWYVDQIARTYKYSLDDVSRAGEVTEIADDTDEAFVISGTSTEQLPAIYGAATAVVRRGDAIVTTSLLGDQSAGDGQEPISPEAAEADLIELTKMVLEQL